MSNLQLKAKRYLLAMAMAPILAGCAVDQALKDSDALAQKGELQSAVDRLKQAEQEYPQDLRLRTAVHGQTDQLVSRLLREADDAIERHEDDVAMQRMETVLQYDPANLRAHQTIEQLRTRGSLHAMLASATALAEREPAAALERVRKILEEDPNWIDAIRLRDSLMRKLAERDSLLPSLDSSLRKPVSLNFRSHNLMSIFETISKLAGVNFIFDSDVPQNTTASISATRTTAEDAINLLLVTNQLRKKVLNHNTLLIYPAKPSKEKEYRDMAVKTFFLAHAPAKEVSSALKSMIKTRDVFVDERINAVVVRDAPETIELAGRLVQALDRPEAEVTLDVQVLEVSSTDLEKMGVEYPQSIDVGLGSVGGTEGAQPGAARKGFNEGDNGRFSLGLLSHLTRDNILVGLGKSAGVSINLLKQTGSAQTLANPKIRVKNGKKAEINIGEKIPVITTITLESGAAEEKVEFQEVGLKVSMTPRVSLSGEISVEVNLNVSSLGAAEQSPKGATYYRSQSRMATTTLTARDNETQVLAGLINRTESDMTAGLPGASQVPLLGRLFGSNQARQDKTEIVLVITPRIERNLELPGAHVTTFISGTEARTGSRALRLRSTEDARTGVNGNGYSHAIKPQIEDVVPREIEEPARPIETPARPVPPHMPPPQQAPLSLLPPAGTPAVSTAVASSDHDGFTGGSTQA